VSLLFITERADARGIGTYLTAADDFIVKPLGAEELEPRVRALIQRAFPRVNQSELFFGPYHFSLNSCSLRFKGALIDTRLKEYELALFLFRNLDRLLSREHFRGVGPKGGEAFSVGRHARVSLENEAKDIS